MGVSGAGKSTVAAAIAQRLSCEFVDADDLHPSSSKAKMDAGIPLTDDDRAPWSGAVADRIRTEGDTHRQIVVACSAPKRSYRDLLRTRAGVPLLFVHFEGSEMRLVERMEGRDGHFIPTSLLRSQLATLEPLSDSDDEAGVIISIEHEVDVIADLAIQRVGELATPAAR